jgi:signal peptidase I
VRRKRKLIPLATLVAVAALLVALGRAELLLVVGGRGDSMAPTIPACNGRGLAEGFTYRVRDPHRGEIVVFHASGEFGGDFTPDPNASGSLEKRVIGIPGETVVGRGGRVLVDGAEADGIRTPPFPPVQLGRSEYFVLGDNRTFSQDSRDFGPVPRDAIFARTVLVFWPLGRFGVPEYDKTQVPPGGPLC